MRALVLVLVAACADRISGSADGGLDEREHAYTIPGGEFVELRVELDEGAVLGTNWSASATLPWEVHAHPFGMT